MKRILLALGITGLLVVVAWYGYTNLLGVSKKEMTHDEYAAYLQNHPVYKQMQDAQEQDKKEKGKNHQDSEEEGKNADRPDLAMLQNYLETMDPKLGRPTPEVLTEWQKNTARIRDMAQRRERDSKAGLDNPDSRKGESVAVTSWTERGPISQGGRTRAIMWDPNDATNKKAWAGGVGGGLWVNTDVTNSNSSWTKVNDLWDNIAISCIAYDPTNTQVFYVGTGENWFQSGSGSPGNGVWKSIDGGASWNLLANSTNFVYVNDIAVRNESGTPVLYVASDRFSYQGQFVGSVGLWRSTDGGGNFTQVLPLPAGGVNRFYAPADIEIAADNRIWIGTKRNTENLGGCTILYSDAGTAGSWTINQDFSSTSSANRVELATAPSDANRIYAVMENFDANNLVKFITTSNKGASWGNMTVPADADQGIPATNYTRGQSWYDLILQVDPTNASIVYAGGIDWFRSTNAGTSWTQISKWSNNNNLAALTCPNVHADQHQFVFRPTAPNEALIGCDGGIYYASSLSTASTVGSSILSRNKGYATIQFYHGAIHPTAGTNFIIAGAQDNGSIAMETAGADVGRPFNGGDGAYCFIDQLDPSFQIASYVYNNYYLFTNNGSTFVRTLAAIDNTGSFINPSAYDSRNKILFSGYSSGSINRVRNVTSASPLVDQVPVTLGAAASAFAVSPFSPTGVSTVYVGTSAGKLFRVNGAHSDSPSGIEITGTGFPVGNIRSISFGASESQILVVLSNYGINNVWETRNGGTTWAAKDGNLPNMPIRWGVYNPRNYSQVYLATELGVWATDDVTGASPTWSDIEAGFANVRTDNLQIRTSDNTILAVTHGRGVFTGNLPAPTIDITSLTPTSGLVGSSVTISGTGFNATAANNTVLFGTTAATVTAATATSLTVTVPATLTPSDYVVSVATGGDNTTAATPYRVILNAPPTIISFAPALGLAGSVVNIVGTNMSGVTGVTFNGLSSATVSTTSNSVAATVPAGATTGLIVLTNAFGTATTASNFTVLPPINFGFSALDAAYSPISGGTSPTLTGGDVDDGWYNGLNIGFSFPYQGQTYTTFSATTNGYLSLGSNQTSDNRDNNLTGGAPRPIIAPYWDDIAIDAGTFSYAVSGTSPNRVLTVQWANAKAQYNATSPNLSIQARLFETTGVVEFHYSTVGAARTTSASIGLTIAAFGPNTFISLGSAAATPTTSTTVETTTINTLPPNGRVYRFAPNGATAAPGEGGSSQTAITLSPNPVRDVLKIQGELPRNKTITINVRSISGELLRKVTVPNSAALENGFDMSGLPTGLYLVSLETESTLGTWKILKQ